MDHSHHSDDMCSMSMIFNWDTKGMCVVFPWWHVKTHFGMVLTFIAVIIFAAGYEWIQKLTRDVDAAFKGKGVRPSDQKKVRIYKSIFYGFQVGYSFLLMLVFMTYNAWLMAATAIGAGIGHYYWGGASSERSMSCH
ncbi:Copper transport protein [Yarrowia sp. B02]|nr:Copper transport protein [Yarrowia sp. B02]